MGCSASTTAGTRVRTPKEQQVAEHDRRPFSSESCASGRHHPSADLPPRGPPHHRASVGSELSGIGPTMSAVLESDHQSSPSLTLSGDKERNGSSSANSMTVRVTDDHSRDLYVKLQNLRADFAMAGAMSPSGAATPSASISPRSPSRSLSCFGDDVDTSDDESSIDSCRNLPTSQLTMNPLAPPLGSGSFSSNCSSQHRGGGPDGNFDATLTDASDSAIEMGSDGILMMELVDRPQADYPPSLHGSRHNSAASFHEMGWTNSASHVVRAGSPGRSGTSPQSQGQAEGALFQESFSTGVQSTASYGKPAVEPQNAQWWRQSEGYKNAVRRDDLRARLDSLMQQSSPNRKRAERLQPIDVEDVAEEEGMSPPNNSPSRATQGPHELLISPMSTTTLELHSASQPVSPLTAEVTQRVIAWSRQTAETVPVDV